METVWFVSLISSICLEGLGRKYLPFLPAAAFYFLKDAVLLFGYIRFRPPSDVARLIRYLYRGFGLVLVIAIGWTVIELFNPSQGSLVLGFIGLRAYWLWWLAAPPVIASVLQSPKHKRRAIYTLLFMAIGVSGLAVVQFAAPANSDLNLYSVVDGEEVYASDIATVTATGRARVASTFTFLSGFQDFTLLVPTLLLSIGLEEKNRRLRWLALGATFCSAAVIPMTGSRASVILGAGVLLITIWAAGLFFTRIGRRVLIGGVVAAVLSVAAFPDAILGVESRFGDQDETNSRYLSQAESFLPLLALNDADYPIEGIGTGMQQNVRIAMHIPAQWAVELEPFRYLVELGPVGFLAVWTAKLGLVFALLRSYALLKRAGRRGAAAAALSYAALTLNGSLTFDHIFQAIYFVGCGFILSEVLGAVRSGAAIPAAGGSFRFEQLAPDPSSI